VKKFACEKLILEKSKAAEGSSREIRFLNVNLSLSVRETKTFKK